MDRKDLLQKFWQYGYEMDIFDKYRESVTRYNRSALKVLGAAGIATGLISLLVMILHHRMEGLIFSAFILAAGIASTVISRMKKARQKEIQVSGYVLCAAFYTLAIYGNVVSGRDAFWVGVNMAMACYLLDYANRLFILQGASFAVLIFALNGFGALTPERTTVSLIFLGAGLVTAYALGHARIGLIMSREVIRHQADTDLLTGLMNRTAAEEEIGTALKAEEEADVMMLIDLDRFKSVNDKLGHQMGDKVLIEVSADLRKMFRNTDVLSRLGGDEFIIFMREVPERVWAEQRAEQVVRTVRRWVTDGTTNIQISASVGVVSTEGMEREFGVLYRAADIAMYFAKEQGGNRAVIYSRDLMNQMRESVASGNREKAGTADDLR